MDSKKLPGFGVSSFLQSSAWEEFQRSLGRETTRVRNVLLVTHSLPTGGHYLYAPRPSALDPYFEDELEKCLRERGSIFAKIDHNDALEADAVGARHSHSIQPEETMFVSLTEPERAILERMHEKTRYNIRLAEKKGVSISTMLVGIETFYRLLQDTAEREKFRLHDKEYYEKLISLSSNDFSNKVFVAHHRGEPVAAALVNFYKPSGTATYLHGGSLRAMRDVMAPYLLHWEIMREAKRKGYRFYDLWGIDEKRWPGLTRFKEGFRGMHIIYPPSVDVVYKPFAYWTYCALRGMNRWRI